MVLQGNLSELHNRLMTELTMWRIYQLFLRDFTEEEQLGSCVLKKD